MDSVQTVRLIGEVIAILVVLAGGFWWVTKLLWRVVRKVEGVEGTTAGINARLDTLNGSVAKHLAEDVVIQAELGKSLARLEGKDEERQAQSAAQAVAAAKLVTDAAAAAALLMKAATDAKKE